ncbi:MAG TPA: hypothetical protein VGM12_16215 [Trebonia sp.]
MIREESTRGEPAGAADLDAHAEAEARRLLAVAFETVPARPGLAGDLIGAAGQQGVAATAGDVVPLVRKRAARARRRRVLVPAGAVALAAAVAAGVTAGVTTGGGGASPTALQAVTAAFVKTSAQSFTFEEYESLPIPHGSLQHLRDLKGEFSPATGNGEQEIYAAGRHVVQYRIIGKYTYVSDGDLQDGKPWVRWSNAGGSTSSVGIANAAGGTVAPINPMDLLAALKGVSTVHYTGPASGTGWTGISYSFTVNPTKDFPAPQVSGTVSVDSSGRVRKLVTTTPLGANRGHVPSFTEIMTFGGFGITVPVTPPPPSEVYIGG